MFRRTFRNNKRSMNEINTKEFILASIRNFKQTWTKTHLIALEPQATNLPQSYHRWKHSFLLHNFFSATIRKKKSNNIFIFP